MKDNPVEKLFWLKADIEEAASIFFYSKHGKLKKVLQALKYRDNTEAGLFLGREVGRRLRASERFANIDCMVPVPLHKSKLAVRGYNQSGLIADGIGEITGVPVLKNVVVRNKKTATQTRKGFYDRWGNVSAVFEVRSPEMLRGKHVLLIDDVITSGSTIASCASAILSSCEDVKVSVVSVAVASD